ncbi:CocE/NonD family hydrolase [Nguyenibacter vanlangensis]|uniref:CocE/NonD family hydrolase n=1 Tax=Nguyenibacter vanlangensis TaxID=1216886 RepID=A0A7Y7IWW8_9PROT|nr:CocE/NonD family hydrolase [Nguyenibacter vanlangensis]NVN11717.1 CocE/NonD family hydrolase [Nguyenibacter vanlangensis]
MSRTVELSKTRSGWLRALLHGTSLAAALQALPGHPRAAPWPAAAGRGSCHVTKQADVPAKMRDGTILRADIYRPDSTAPVPVILMRTQYGKDAAQVQPSRFQTPDWFASHCYLVVVQDIRGQGKSGGTFYEYRYDRDDGYDTVEWAARLPGADGKVGMYGSSYVGATQWLAATASPPSLKTIVPSNTGSDYYDGWTYEDGAFRLAFIAPWMMETIASSAAANRGDTALAAELRADGMNPAAWLRDTPYLSFPPLRPGDPKVAPYFYDAIRHPSRDGYWKAFEIRSRYPNVQVPVLAFDGWYDSFLTGALENFNGMRTQGGTPAARRNQRIILGPWEHLGWGRPDSLVSPRLKAIGPVSDSPVNELMLAWFDHFLKGKDDGVQTGPRIDYFTMGENRWHVADRWPVAGTTYQTWYLGSARDASSVMGDGALTTTPPGSTPPSPAAPPHGTIDPARLTAPSDHFVYDPANPVPSIGGHSCCAWNSGPQGQFDQSAIEQRPDILVYTSNVLTAPLNVTGPITVILYATTTARDTDFTAKLVDVHPDGSAINLNNGIVVARYRASLTDPTPITPNQIYEYRIKVWPTSNLFLPGHRIRLEISSSDFPQFAPNPNTGAPFGHSAAIVKATQTIWHDAAHRSALILPVLPPQAAGSGVDHPPVD